MDKVSLIFTATPTPLGWAIRKLTRSDVSHVILGYTCLTWGGRWTAGASLDGLRLHRAEHTCHHVVDEFDCLFDPNPGMREIANLIDYRYDFIALPAFGFTILAWRWFKKKVRTPWNDPAHQICSEFIARFLQASHLPGTEDWNPEAASPKRIKKYCLKHPELFSRKSLVPVP